MSNPRLLEIALLPLDQRAALIARLFSEGEDESRRAPLTPAAREPRKPLTALARKTRGLAVWAAPRRLPAAVRALVRFAREAVFGRDPFAPRRPVRGVEGFYGFVSAPDAETALALLAQGHYCGAFSGLVSLWSPARRAIMRLPVDLPVPASALPGSKETCQLDKHFDRSLDLCVGRKSLSPRALERKPALADLLGGLHRLGFAHALDTRDADGAISAVVLGVASGRIFSVEGFFARDRYSLASAVTALAPQLARLNFTAIDFREFGPELAGLPIELISRESFAALLRDSGADAAIGYWKGDRAAPVRPALRRAA